MKTFPRDQTVGGGAGGQRDERSHPSFPGMLQGESWCLDPAWLPLVPMLLFL